MRGTRVQRVRRGIASLAGNVGTSNSSLGDQLVSACHWSADVLILVPVLFVLMNERSLRRGILAKEQATNEV